MIGVTQLLSRPLSITIPAGTQSDPFTSYEQVAGSGYSNGLYYFDDGTRTRQMYFDIDGTENGTNTKGWARWDTNIDSNYYEGTECVLADSGIDSNGIISIRAGVTPTGDYAGNSNHSSAHGGCGIGSNSAYVKASKLAFSNTSFTSASTSYRYSRFQVYKSPETLRSDWRFNQSGNCGNHYAGYCPFPTSNTTDNMILYMHINVVSPNSSHAPPSTRTAANESSFTDGTYKPVTGYEYSLGETADIIFHFGQISYPSASYKHSLKVWFKY